MKKLLPIAILLLLLTLSSCEDSSIGIIGGADGPAAIMISK